MGGESGPKARPKGVVDGKQVNIPVLIQLGTEGRRRLNWNCYWISVEAFRRSFLKKRARIKTMLLS